MHKEQDPHRRSRFKREFWNEWTNLEKAAAFFFSLAILSTMSAIYEKENNTGNADRFGGEIVLFGVIAAGLLIANEVRINRKPPTR